jgi:hypothetical protein
VTVRDRIAAMQTAMLGDLTPLQASELSNRAVALLGYVMVEERESELAYLKVLDAALDSQEAANRAKVRAQASEEYARYRTAKDARVLVLEMSRTLKAFARASAEEFKATV